MLIVQGGDKIVAWQSELPGIHNVYWVVFKEEGGYPGDTSLTHEQFLS